MTKVEILKMLDIIKLNYSYAYKNVTAEDFSRLADFWLNSLQDYNDEIVAIAFKKALETCEMPPTLASIMNRIEEIEQANCNANEYWNEIEQAVARVSRLFMWGDGEFIMGDEIIKPNEKANEIFSGLSLVARNWLGNMQTLKSMSNAETLEYEKARFVKDLPRTMSKIKLNKQYNLNQIGVENRIMIGE